MLIVMLWPITAGMEICMTKEISQMQSAGMYIKDDGLTEVKLFLPDDLARAWQRCSWILVNETGRDRVDIMKEMVTDYLLKNGC